MYGEVVWRAVVVGEQREGDVVVGGGRRGVEAAPSRLLSRRLRQQGPQPTRRHHQRGGQNRLESTL